MSNYSRGEVILVRYPFSDLSGSKIRPAVIVNAPHPSKDVFILPLTSKTTSLLAGEFILKDWSQAGLNVETAVKRGVYTVHQNLIAHRVGKLSDSDAKELNNTLRLWFGL
jgi:mRNA-degrading endonuclease toxin of MazEF toxin-antitoxin module